MLKRLANPNQARFWILFHIAFGVACAIFKEIFIIWFVFLAISSIPLITTGSPADRRIHLVWLIAYFASMELLSRMTKAHSYGLPWEYGKYVILVGSLYGITVLGARRGTVGMVLFFLLLPGMFISPVYSITRHAIAFNLLGLLAMIAGIVFMAKLEIDRERFQSMLRLILLPAVSVLGYTVFKTPDLKGIEFQLGANFETAGGFGSNQVSTVLGMGMFITFLFWVNRWTLTKNRILDTILLVGFAFQGLLTFSRGGVIGGVLAILVVLYFFSLTGRVRRFMYRIPSVGKFLIPTLIVLFAVFSIVDNITGGILSLRYQGETNATLLGKADKDLTTLTTGRFNIFMADVELWKQHVVSGGGVGSSIFLRGDPMLGVSGQAAHVELSRLLAEHGLFGLFFFVIWLYIGLRLLRHDTNPKYQSILLALFVLALYTTFHAATRTFLTPLFTSLALLQIVDINEPETALSEADETNT